MRVNDALENGLEGGLEKRGPLRHIHTRGSSYPHRSVWTLCVCRYTGWSEKALNHHVFSYRRCPRVKHLSPRKAYYRKMFIQREETPRTSRTLIPRSLSPVPSPLSPIPACLKCLIGIRCGTTVCCASISACARSRCECGRLHLGRVRVLHRRAGVLS